MESRISNWAIYTPKVEFFAICGLTPGWNASWRNNSLKDALRESRRVDAREYRKGKEDEEQKCEIHFENRV